MKKEIPSFLLDKPPSSPGLSRTGGLSASFVDKAVVRISAFIRTSYVQWELASREGLFQRLDPRLKVLFVALFIVIVSLKGEILPEVLLGLLLLPLVVLSRLGIVLFYRKVLAIGFIFGFLIALPSALNIVRGGDLIVPLMRLPSAFDLWIYHIPQTIGLTREGLAAVAMLTLRVVNSVALTFLLLYTTPFADIIKALRVFRLPDTMLIVLTLTYKYIFIFTQTVEDMHLAKKSRMAQPVSEGEMREWLAGRIAFLFRKSQTRFEEIYRAMQARGFSGSIKVDGFRTMTLLDWTAGIVFLCIGTLFLIL